MKNEILNALEAQYKAQKIKNEVLLQNYLQNSAGIGEHPDIIEECSKIIEAISSANDNLNTIYEMRNHFNCESL